MRTVFTFKSTLSLLFLAVATTFVVACGGGGSQGGGKITVVKVTGVSVTATPATIAANQKSTCAADVSHNDSTVTHSVTWTATGGTIDGNGNFTPTAAGTGTCTAKSTEDPTQSGFANITITALPPSIDSVTLKESAKTILSTQTLTVTPTVKGKNSFDDTVVLSMNPASAGALSASSGVSSGTAVTFTPDATGITATTSVTITATSTEDSTKSAQVTFTVTVAPPPQMTITGLSYTTMYADKEPGFPTITILGTNFPDGVLVVADPNTSTDPSQQVVVQAVNVTSSTTIDVTLGMGTPESSPGPITFKVCKPDATGCTNPWPLAYFGSQNVLSLCGGLPYFLDQAQFAPDGQNGYVRKYKGNGTADLNWFIGALSYTVACDSATGNIFVTPSTTGGIGEWDQNGVLVGGVNGGGDSVAAISIQNGWVANTSPKDGLIASVPTDGSASAQTASVGSEPWSLAMMTNGTETDAYSLARDGSPALYKTSIPDMTVKNSAPLTGFTPSSTVQPANTLKGGWYVEAFGSGPAKGTVATLSTFDNLLIFFDASPKETKSVSLASLDGVPYRIATDETNGELIVEYLANADLSAGKIISRFAAVDPSTGDVVLLGSTSKLMGIGFRVSADGTKLYVAMRDKLEILSNK